MTLAELVRVTSLDCATLETVMGTFEGRHPVPVIRTEMAGATIAWKLTL